MEKYFALERKHIFPLILTLAATIGFGTAYLVYRNGVMQEGQVVFPISATVFWFMLFGALATLPISLFNPKIKQFTSSPSSSIDPHQTLIDSLKRIWEKDLSETVLLDSILFTIQFALTIYALSEKKPGIVLIVVLTQALRPALISLGSNIYVKERLHPYSLFWLGLGLAILGVFVYQCDFSQTTIFAFDRTFWLTACLVVVSSSQTIVQGRYRRKHGIQSIYPMTIVLTIGTIFSFFWMLTACHGQIAVPPNGTIWFAVIYLGVVPSGICKLFQVISEESMSMQQTNTIVSTSTFFVILVSYVSSHVLFPFHELFYTPLPNRMTQWIGISLTFVGILITILLVKRIKEKKEKTS
ncbi:MAG: EamA-like protein transporter family protein [Candidatus Uhrbacteria bacterium GW2011_GWE2_40_58]|nr:MAG: EamA-like protein transporter family protein [Candidatus Uhrbacteria bacterium GW2011_GWF2_40_263]KKR67192.1 MAG: EamA-like protein transporter family protein [Candidatus Uhrbacteria bacterium GW2011_GWE2_40_58]OGL93755.1 MAG: hypothetical protein A2239_01865 [Candidatus Uhrbacteria bacterium RIFOXYA2_FULL_40_9]OGL96613.1 MAG: hypothetical protein A2332_03200 [Candidatus Uhrbacteria bacterium RIFOXYB2_FULL_41_18]HBK34598.1 hypothetical protein [Candidatus Uhrbacteria bacterium]